MSLLTCFFIVLLQLLASCVNISACLHADTHAGPSTSAFSYPKRDQHMKVEKKLRVLTWTANKKVEENEETSEYRRPAAAGKRMYYQASKKQLTPIKQRMGSRPPLCSNKCNACNPCEAVQVPTPLRPNRKRSAAIAKKTISTAASSDSFHLDYSNYEPEGWKCKCGSLVYNP